MIFYNENVNKYLQDLYRYTDEQVAAMRFSYMDTIMKMMLDECLTYAEKNKVEEFPQIMAKLKEKTAALTKQSELLEIVFKLPGKYPELKNRIASEIERIDGELLGEITRDMNEAEASGLLELMKQELDQIDKFSEKYLKKSPQTTK